MTVNTVNWDGGDDAMIADETDPFLTTLDGMPVDLLAIQRAGKFAPAATGCEGCDGGLMAGVAAPWNSSEGIERCDLCDVFPGDLDAAQGLALHLISQRLVTGLMNVTYIPHPTDPHYAAKPMTGGW